MSSSVCRTCRNSGACTYPRNQIIVQCEEYEYADARRERAAEDEDKRCRETAQAAASPGARLSAA